MNRLVIPLTGWVVGLLFFPASEVSATARFVAPGGANVPPYTNWQTAASTIQAAIDVSHAGDVIYISNGVYHTGGRADSGYFTNRVYVDKPLTLIGVGAVEDVVVQGADHTRCAYVCSGSRVENMTFRGGWANGAAENQQRGGGVFADDGAWFFNCTFVSNVAGSGGGAYGGKYDSCVFRGNQGGLAYGGGAASAYLTNCVVENNQGGGLYCATGEATVVVSNTPFGGRNCDLHDCRIEYNSSGHRRIWDGGGVALSTVSRSVLKHNRAWDGGAAANSVLRNCLVVSNYAEVFGGGIYQCEAYNCFIAGNKANSGGASFGGTLFNCTVVENSAHDMGGPCDGSAYNTIVWDNHADWGPNGSFYRYNCNTGEPGIADAWNPLLLASSPCVDAGTNQVWMAGASDLAGCPRIAGSAVDIGAFEYCPSNRTGTLTIAVSCSPFAGTTAQVFHLAASIQGNPLDCVWETGDGVSISGHTEISHRYVQTGVYHAVFRTWNLDGEATASIPVYVLGEDIYVAPSGDDANLGADWQHPKRTIQAAIESAWPGVRRVLVSNGVYQLGGRSGPGGLTNRVFVDKPLRLESVNGPKHTVIKGCAGTTTNGFGPDAIRCIYAATQCWISGFTIYGGHTLTAALYRVMPSYWPWCSDLMIVTNTSSWAGGGIWAATTNVVVSNCVFIGNRAAGNGGGMSGGTALHCIFLRNEACGNGAEESGQGGGCYDSVVSNCLFVANVALNGGAMAFGRASHCTMIQNRATGRGGGIAGTVADYCLIRRNSASLGGALGTGVSRQLRAGSRPCGPEVYFWSSGAVARHSTIEDNQADWGGAAVGSHFDRCVIRRNRANVVGVLLSSAADSCLIIDNQASVLSVALASWLKNCTVVGNISTDEESIGYYSYYINSIVVSNSGDHTTQLSYNNYYNCCTWQRAPEWATSNVITGDPLFVDPGKGDYRLRANSPCINRGSNLPELAASTDLADNPRIQCGAMDLGAYESPYWGMHSDVDGDGIKDYEEFFIAGTDPTNAASVLAVAGTSQWVTRAGQRQLVISWHSKTGRVYSVYRATNLYQGAYTLLQSGIPGRDGTTSFTDTTASAYSAAFYQIVASKEIAGAN